MIFRILGRVISCHKYNLKPIITDSIYRIMLKKIQSDRLFWIKQRISGQVFRFDMPQSGIMIC